MNKCGFQQPARRRLRVADMNPHLLCILCGGYFVDATTIIECLHSFCKSCLVRYLESNKYCPICEVQVHKTRPLQNIRPDETLQNMVYKLVPGLFQKEMKIRQEFYLKHPEAPESNPKDRGVIDPIECQFYSPEEAVSLALEFKSQGNTLDSSNGVYKRYLRCPAAVTIAHLQKLVRNKFGLASHFEVDVMFLDKLLQPELTIMDVAYAFQRKRKEQFHFTYRIVDSKSKKMRFDAPVPHTDSTNPEPMDVDTAPSLTLAVPPISAASQIAPEGKSKLDSIISRLGIAKQTEEAVKKEKVQEEWKEVQLQISENGEMRVTDISSLDKLIDTVEKNISCVESSTCGKPLDIILKTDTVDKKNSDTAKPEKSAVHTLNTNCEAKPLTKNHTLKSGNECKNGSKGESPAQIFNKEEQTKTESPPSSSGLSLCGSSQSLPTCDCSSLSAQSIVTCSTSSNVPSKTVHIASPSFASPSSMFTVPNILASSTLATVDFTPGQSVSVTSSSTSVTVQNSSRASLLPTTSAFESFCAPTVSVTSVQTPAVSSKAASSTTAVSTSSVSTAPVSVSSVSSTSTVSSSSASSHAVMKVSVATTQPVMVSASIAPSVGMPSGGNLSSATVSAVSVSSASLSASMSSMNVTLLNVSSVSSPSLGISSVPASKPVHAAQTTTTASRVAPVSAAKQLSSAPVAALNTKKSNASPVGYKTLKCGPKSWNPTISRNSFLSSKLEQQHHQTQPPDGSGSSGASGKPATPPRFFKMRNTPRYLGNPASGVKAMYQVPDSLSTQPATPQPAPSKAPSVMKLDPRTLTPIVSNASSPTAKSPSSQSKGRPPFPSTTLSAQVNNHLASSRSVATTTTTTSSANKMSELSTLRSSPSPAQAQAMVNFLNPFVQKGMHNFLYAGIPSLGPAQYANMLRPGLGYPPVPVTVGGFHPSLPQSVSMMFNAHQIHRQMSVPPSPQSPGSPSPPAVQRIPASGVGAAGGEKPILPSSYRSRNTESVKMNGQDGTKSSGTNKSKSVRPTTEQGLSKSASSLLPKDTVKMSVASTNDNNNTVPASKVKVQIEKNEGERLSHNISKLLPKGLMKHTESQVCVETKGVGGSSFQTPHI